MYNYTWYQWLLIFYIYCFIGWCIESTYVSFQKKRLVNRGFLRLPMLPLYGTGAVMMLFASAPVRDSMLLTFLAGMAGATALEYVTGVAMERLFKVRYWDYSHDKFQFQGHICLGSSICWGLLTILLTRYIHRPVEVLILGINRYLSYGITLTVTAVFAADTINSVKAALDLGKALETMTKLKGEWEELQAQLEELKQAALRQIEGLQESTEQRLEGLKDGAEKQLNTLHEKLILLREEYEHTKKRLSLSRFHLLWRNPTASSRRFEEALRELKERSERRFRR